LLLETVVKAKMLTFVLTTEKRLEVSFWRILKCLGNQGELENQNHLKLLLMQE